jgi:hypothetical protein
LHLKILNIKIFQNISSTILLDKNNKKSIEELFTKNLKMAERSKMADIGSDFSKNCHNSTVEYFFVFSAGLFLEKFNLTKIVFEFKTQNGHQNSILRLSAFFRQKNNILAI